MQENNSMGGKSYTQIETAERIASDFNLLPSGGSDFHGKTKPNISMGTGTGDLSVPMEVYYGLRDVHEALISATTARFL